MKTHHNVIKPVPLRLQTCKPYGMALGPADRLDSISQVEPYELVTSEVGRIENQKAAVLSGDWNYVGIFQPTVGGISPATTDMISPSCEEQARIALFLGCMQSPTCLSSVTYACGMHCHVRHTLITDSMCPFEFTYLLASSLHQSGEFDYNGSLDSIYGVLKCAVSCRMCITSPGRTHTGAAVLDHISTYETPLTLLKAMQVQIQTSQCGGWDQEHQVLR